METFGLKRNGWRKCFWEGKIRLPMFQEEEKECWRRESFGFNTIKQKKKKWGWTFGHTQKLRKRNANFGKAIGVWSFSLKKWEKLSEVSGCFWQKKKMLAPQMLLAENAQNEKCISAHLTSPYQTVHTPTPTPHKFGQNPSIHSTPHIQTTRPSLPPTIILHQPFEWYDLVQGRIQLAFYLFPHAVQN